MAPELLVILAVRCSLRCEGRIDGCRRGSSSIKARSDRARRRGLYLQVKYAYSSSCHLRHFQLRHCTVNDVILAQVLSGDGV